MIDSLIARTTFNYLTVDTDSVVIFSVISETDVPLFAIFLKY